MTNYNILYFGHHPIAELNIADIHTKWLGQVKFCISDIMRDIAIY